MYPKIAVLLDGLTNYAIIVRKEVLFAFIFFILKIQISLIITGE